MLRRERQSLVLLVLAVALAAALSSAGCGTLQTTSADSNRYDLDHGFFRERHDLRHEPGVDSG